MKTFKGWEESNLDLREYMPHPCEIDEELYLYICEVVPPTYLGWDDGLTQGGDAMKGDDVLYYMTVSVVDEKHYYLGVLPEFRQ